MLEKRRKVTPRDVFLLGAIGKLLATSITYPYITIKSRMHVKEGTKEGMGRAVKRAVREEGWGGLYKGRSDIFLVCQLNMVAPQGKGASGC